MKNLAKKMKKRIAPVIIAAMCAGTAAGIMSCDTGTGGTTGNGNEYDKDGFDKDGYDRNGYDRDGYNRNGYDAEGYNREGYNQNGEKRPNGSGEYLADPVEDIKFVVFDDETVSSVESEVRRKRGQFINQSETIKTQYSRWKAELMTQGTDGNDPRMKFADNMEAEEGRLIRYLGGAAGGGGGIWELQEYDGRDSDTFDLWFVHQSKRRRFVPGTVERLPNGVLYRTKNKGLSNGRKKRRI